MDPSGPKHLALTLTHVKFESLVHNLIERTVEPCKKALADATLSMSEIGKVILVGRITRMPAFQKKVKELFSKEANKSVNRDEAVAIGGILTPLIERKTTIPTQKKQIFSTAGNNQPAVTIVALHGERKMARNNKEIHRFEKLKSSKTRRNKFRFP